MKIDIIDCRGFVKTPPYQSKPSNSRELKKKADYFVYTDNQTTGNTMEKLHKI